MEKVISVKEDLQSLLKEPQQTVKIDQAVRYQKKINMFTESVFDDSEFTTAHNDFLNNISAAYDSTKAFQRFDFIFKNHLPLPTAETVDESIKQLHRIVTADGGRIMFAFDNPNTTLRFNSERKKTLKDDDVIKKQIFKNVINNVTSICVIDNNEDKGSFYNFVPSECMRDFGYCIDELGNTIVTYIIYKSGHNQYTLIDGFSYMTVKVDDSYTITEVIQESEHGIGYAPCTLTFQQNSGRNPLINYFPISKQLGGLTSLLKKITENEQLKEYARLPIAEKYGESKTYDAYKEDRVQHLSDETGDYAIDRSSDIQAEKGEMSEMVSPATVILKPAPLDKDSPDFSNSLTWIAPPIESLNYNDEDVEKEKARIYKSIVGNGAMGTYKNDSARNESEIRAGFEGLKSTLDLFKKPIEQTHKFIVNTCAILDVNQEPTVSVVSYGNEYYLKPVSELEEEFKRAKESGASESTLLSIRKDIIHTKYIDDTATKERELLLLELEPFPVHSISEAREQLSDNIVSLQSLQIKAYFNNLVQKLENSFGNIVEYVDMLVDSGGYTGRKEAIDFIFSQYFTLWLEDILKTENKEENNETKQEDEINQGEQI